MNQSLHLTDDEALDSLLRCVKYQGEDEVSTLIIAVVGSHFQTQWIVHNVQEVLNEATFNKTTRVLHYKSTRVTFVRYDENLNALSAIKPVVWLPLCDNIPAKMISWLNYRTERGKYMYCNRKERMSRDIKIVLGIDISEDGYTYCLVANNSSFGTQQLITVGTEKPSENIPEDIMRIIHIVGKYCLKGVPDKLLLDEEDYRKLKNALIGRFDWKACEGGTTFYGIEVEEELCK